MPTRVGSTSTSRRTKPGSSARPTTISVTKPRAPGNWEAWFIGKADNDQCHETARARQLGSPSKLWAEFTQKTAGYLRDHGREVIFWGEEPLQAEDIPLLPSG